jgi:acetyl esterase/lipase
MEPLVNTLWVLWSLGFLLLSLNVFSPLSSRTEGTAPALVVGFGSGWLVGDLAPIWVAGDFAFVLLLQASGVVEPLSSGWLLIHLGCAISLLTRWYGHLTLSSRLRCSSDETFPFTPRRNSLKQALQETWFPHKPEEAGKQMNLTYHPGLPQECRMDLRFPVAPQRRAPVLLYVHGGGWHVGTKTQGLPLVRRMNQEGWVGATITYRMSPSHHHPAPVEDVLQALTYLQENAERYSLDPERIVLAGGSAGAHLVSLGAFQAQARGLPVLACAAFYGIYDVMNPFRETSPYPAARQVLSSYLTPSIISTPSLLREASPRHCVPEKPVPFLLVQGSNDSLVDSREMSLFGEKLREQGGKVTEILVPGLQHAFDVLPTVAAHQVCQPVSAWLNFQAQRDCSAG